MDIDGALRELGDTPREVAARLAALGVRGYRLRLCSCPVARYLAGRFPGHTFEVDGNAAVIADNARLWQGPPPVRGFLADFDGGKHPELEVVPECE